MCYFLASGDSTNPISFFAPNSYSEKSGEWAPPTSVTADLKPEQARGAFEPEAATASTEWSEFADGMTSLNMLTQDIESRGVGQFAEALEKARKKCASMSDERLKAALHAFGGATVGASEVHPV